MELNLQRQSIAMTEAVYDGYTEQPVECDALLPDYCPDIVKILKCALTASIGSAMTNADRLVIEGVAVAHIYYAGEGGEIRHVEYKVPFSKSVELRSAPSMPVISVVPSVDYVNCRAVNSRRVDVRGALSLAVKVTERKEEKVISDAQGCGVQLRKSMVRCTELLGRTESSFNISEELELGYGKPPIRNIVRADYRINVTDHKIVAGKAVVKADFLLHICYQPAAGESSLEVMEYSLPISQIADSDAADENCICDVEMCIVSCDIQPRTGEDGEMRSLSLDAGVKVIVTAARHVDVPVASDCYSTQYDSKATQKTVSLPRLTDSIKETITHKATLDLPEDVENVLDCWCDLSGLVWKYEPGAVTMTLQFIVGLFAQMADGEAVYFEQSSEMEHTANIGADCERISFDPACDIISSSYSLVGKEKIDIRCEAVAKGHVYCTVNVPALTDIAIDEAKPKVKEESRMYIYYAEPGESLWDISKRYNTSPNAIWEENAADSDILPEKKMLLIPIV